MKAVGFRWNPSLPPTVIREFTGQRTAITRQARIKRVCFANCTDEWTFLVLEGPPAPVVVGLDMIRQWQLCHDPRTDQVFVLEAPISSAVSGNFARVTAMVAAAQEEEQDARATNCWLEVVLPKGEMTPTADHGRGGKMSRRGGGIGTGGGGRRKLAERAKHG